MTETIIQIQQEEIFIRHNEIKPHRQTLLLVHGLGETGMCFREIFAENRLAEFNLLVPDLVGCGKSSKINTGDCSFTAHVQRLWLLLAKFEINDVIAIGHSLGGDITTLMCASDTQGIIKKYVNIEGDITPFDLFISSAAVKAEETGNFLKWFQEDFKIATVRDNWGKHFASCRRYYESLNQWDPLVFLANARELVARNNNHTLPGETKSEIGRIYTGLKLPRVYCYGTKSISAATLRFLNENHLDVMSFENAGHWVMIDKAAEFYAFLYHFVTQT